MAITYFPLVIKHMCLPKSSLVFLSAAVGQTVWRILCANCLIDVQPVGDLFLIRTKV